MPGESCRKLTHVFEALKSKLIYHHNESALKSQSDELLECFTDLMQKTSDITTWHTLLDDLLCDPNGNPMYRNAQADLIEQSLDRAHEGLRQIAARAQQIGTSQ